MKKRVKIPTNPAQLVALAKRVKDKHTTDGDASALRILNWQQVAPIVDESIQLQERTEQLKRELMKTYEKRDLRINDLTEFLRNSRDILAGKYGVEMKALGEWGYDVLDVRLAKAKEEPVTLKQSA